MCLKTITRGGVPTLTPIIKVSGLAPVIAYKVLSIQEEDKRFYGPVFVHRQLYYKEGSNYYAPEVLDGGGFHAFFLQKHALAYSKDIERYRSSVGFVVARVHLWGKCRLGYDVISYSDVDGPYIDFDRRGPDIAAECMIIKEIQ